MGTRYPVAASMARIIASVAILAACGQSAPQSDPSLARILQEQRFNAGAGKFGSAFAQEDGVVYREESVGNNERVGQYSYIGTMARPTPSSTAPVSMGSGSSEEITSP